MSNSSRYHYEKLFEAQLETLTTKNIPNRIIRKLAEKRYRLANQSPGIDQGIWTFIPVIPFTELSLEEQIKMVYHGNHSGSTKLNDGAINDLEPIGQPYYIIAVNEGSEYTGLNGKEAGDLFLELNKNPLSVAECLALAIHTNLLNRHNVLAIGSRHKNGDEILAVGLKAGHPVLKLVRQDFSDHTYSVPYCGNRIV